VHWEKSTDETREALHADVLDEKYAGECPSFSTRYLRTSTPGTGKTTDAQLLVQQSPVPLQHIIVSELVKEKMLHDGFDEEWQTYLIDEVKVCALVSSPSLARVRSYEIFRW